MDAVGRVSILISLNLLRILLIDANARNKLDNLIL